jgi:hypothetical protein
MENSNYSFWSDTGLIAVEQEEQRFFLGSKIGGKCRGAQISGTRPSQPFLSGNRKLFT